MDRNVQHLKYAALLVVTLGLASATAFASQRWETLQAINWVENPHDSTKVGPHGELGPYQFRISTWRDYSSKPFACAVIRKDADEVAVMHYDWIKRGLERNGIAATPFNIALAWNAGLSSVVNRSVPAASYAYAEHVNNLVTKLKSQLASTR
jgi:hypothetical protein